MPFASAAFNAEVTMRVPITPASRGPPSDFAYATARLPGSRRVPETMAATLSTR
jgi:hypothetical protein